MQIYLAGPLFTLAEKDFNYKLAGVLETLGFTVFLPQRDAPQGGHAFSVWSSDVVALVASDIVVAIVDGVPEDTGTVWECGFVQGLDWLKAPHERGYKPIILVRTDNRCNGERADQRAPVNLMLSESPPVCATLYYTGDFVEDLAHRIARTINLSLSSLFII